MAEQARTAPAARPLSPHLQIYRWPITMATSIAHRVTGVGLAIGTLIVAWWLLALAAGPQYYDTFSMIARHPLGQIVLFCFVWSLTYHLLNGIRHLAWDIGLGFDVQTANRSAFAVIALSLLFAIAVFAYAYAAKGVYP